MKNVLFNGFILMALVLTYSCTPCSSGEHEEKENVHIKKSDEHNSKAKNLVLNDGKPWETQVEMTNRVNNMLNMLDSFSDKNNVVAYNELSGNLNQEFDMIFKECTMTGEAHNQLHNFLIPVKDMLNDLSSSDIEKCKHGYEQLKKHLAQYGTYFK